MILKSIDSLAAFELLAPGKIVFGWGRRGEVGELARGLGQRCFLVVGSRTLVKTGVVQQTIDCLSDAGVKTVGINKITSREPQVEDVDDATKDLLGRTDADFVMALGGGSAIDLGKAVAAMAANRESDTVRDYLEGVGKGLHIVERPLPFLAMPTTGGTGSEATKNAVITSYDPPFKKSLRADSMIADVVLIDPQLAVTAPRDVTVHSGLDAITQCIESFISRRATTITRALAKDGLKHGWLGIRRVAENGGDREGRERMAYAALLSGLALANSGLGMVHGIAAALGCVCQVPHGLACAAMLPVGLRKNREIARNDLAELASALELRGQGDPADWLIRDVEVLCEELGIPRRLADLFVDHAQIGPLVIASRGNSMSGNPRELSDTELIQILSASI